MNRPRYWLTHWRFLLAIAAVLLLINLVVDQPWKQHNIESDSESTLIH